MLYGIVTADGRVLFTSTVRSTVIRLAGTRSFPGTVHIRFSSGWAPLDTGEAWIALANDQEVTQ